MKAFILKQGADGIPVADICRKAGISEATFYNWWKKYAGLTSSDGDAPRSCVCRLLDLPERIGGFRSEDHAANREARAKSIPAHAASRPAGHAPSLCDNTRVLTLIAAPHC